MEAEDDRLIVGEDGGVFGIGKSMRMVAIRNQLEEIDDVDEADLDGRKVFSQERRGREGFLGHNIPARGYYQVRLPSSTIRSPIPHSDTLGAMYDGVLHAEVLQMILFVRDDDIDIVFAFQTVIHCRKKAIGVRGQIDPDHFW